VRQFRISNFGLRIGTTTIVIVALALSVIGPPLAAGAEQAEKIPRLGVVLHGGPYYAVFDGLRDGLKAVGLEDGQRVTLEVRDAKGDVKAAEAAAHALEQERVSLIVSITTSVSLAVKRATAQVRPADPRWLQSQRPSSPGGRSAWAHRELQDGQGPRDHDPAVRAHPGG
jgi:hypothetical protein